nr:hypothetical protein CFP56_73359 [Quercus suber]
MDVQRTSHMHMHIGGTWTWYDVSRPQQRQMLSDSADPSKVELHPFVDGLCDICSQVIEVLHPTAGDALDSTRPERYDCPCWLDGDLRDSLGRTNSRDQSHDLQCIVARGLSITEIELQLSSNAAESLITVTNRHDRHLRQHRRHQKDCLVQRVLLSSSVRPTSLSVFEAVENGNANSSSDGLKHSPPLVGVRAMHWVSHVILPRHRLQRYSL